MATNPEVTKTYADLPGDADARAEFELDLFGQHLFFLRNRRLAAIKRLVESAEAQGQLGTIRRRVYEAVGALDDKSRAASLELVETAIDLYMQDILALLSSSGTSLRLGPEHAIRYKLIMEIIDQDHRVQVEDVINRRHLPGYFGRWLNRYKTWGVQGDNDERDEMTA